MNIIQTGLTLLRRMSSHRPPAGSLGHFLLNSSGLFSGQNCIRPITQVHYPMDFRPSPPYLTRQFSSLGPIQDPLFQPPQSLPFVNLGGARTVIQRSMQSGRRKTVGAVIDRFFRLHWGIWIRTKAGRNKKLYRKTNRMRKAAREHVFCSATQSRMLDKMVSPFWHKKTYYVDDPYESYHKRENYPATRKL